MGRYEFKREDLNGLIAFIHAETREHGDEVQFKECPYCHGKGDDFWKFSVNSGNGCYKCLRASCNAHGFFIELARDVGFEVESDEPTYRQLKQPPEGTLKVMDAAIEYLKSRGISEEVTRRFEVTVRKSKPHIMVFPFYNEYGTLKSYKYRNMLHKKGDKGSKEWFEADTMPILFGMKQCTSFNRLIITEGQIDSLSVAEAGFENAVSVPGGCNSFTWVKNVWEWINRFEEIVVFGDWETGK